MAQGEGSAKPGFRNGFPMGDVPDGGMLLGQADEDVILVHWQWSWLLDPNFGLPVARDDCQGARKARISGRADAAR
jgi:hypothetical protein